MKSRSEMVKLLFLPSELLSQILHYHGASAAAIALWRCGDASLNLRIADLVTEIDLEDGNPASTSRYPKMLSSLHKLRSLRITRRGWLAPPHILSQELQKLPASLMELEIRSSNGISPLRRFPSHLSPDILQQWFLNGGAHYSFWNIGAKFPNLLKLAFWSDFQDYASLRIDKEILWALPPLLQHLELSVNLSTDSMLPGSLHTLKTHVMTNFLNWPSTLTNLSGHLASSSSHSFASILAKLPSGLKSLPSVHLDSLAPLASIPTSLQRLHITMDDQFDSNHVDWLANSSLTDLSIPRLNVAQLLALPRHMTSLRVSSINWQSVYSHFGPDGLENWKLLWPPKLLAWSGEWAETDFADHKEDAWFDPIAILRSLPNTITEISDFHVPKWIRELPVNWDMSFPSLRSLDVSLNHVFFPLGFGAHLDRLELSLNVFDPASFERLSAAPLTTLTLQFQFASSLLPDLHAQLMELLPKKLARLSLSFFLGGLAWVPTAWSQLPITLNTFKLSLRSDYKLSPSTSQVMPYMPPNLTELALSLSDTPTSADLLALPCYAKLRRLSLRFDALAAKMDAKEILRVWPEASLLAGYDPGSGWNSNNTSQLLLPKSKDLAARAKLYPDPRVLA